MILPYKNENTYIVFHKTLDDETFDSIISPSLRLKYSIVDMSKDNNLGEVIVKDKVFLQDTMVNGEISACRHANGKDWWILTPQWSIDGSNNNQYYSLLLKKDTILGPYQQRIGEAPKGATSHQACFSPDGTKYVRVRAKDGLYIFDFDRNTGLLSNAKPIVKLNNNAYTYGVAFSPNSKYIYASCDTVMWQLDATATNPDATKEIIAEYDGFKVNGVFASTFDNALLAPDCKIYVAHAGTIEYLTVINYPNRKGKASGIEQHGLKLPTKVAWGLPNYPHFRLGAVGETHTPCDSTINPYINSNFKTTGLDDAIAPAITVALYPNPAQEEINVDLFGYVNRYKSGVWELYDIQGQRVAFYPIFENKSEYRYDIAPLNNGMYFWRVIFDGKIGQSGKLVILK
jgi:Secretion system C-terminal sorting domain